MARWTRNELLLALNLYLETPFGRQHQNYPPIIRLAEKLGRTPSAIALKLNNFTSLDPVEKDRGIKGMSTASKLDKEIWIEFENDKERLAAEIEGLLDEYGLVDKEIRPLPPLPLETESKSLVTVRRNQNFFRRIVLRSSDIKCCITGNPIPELLRASHIVPWSSSVEDRLNPRNGLCLAATFDAAFDRGLIAFDENFRLLLSPKLKRHELDPEIAAVFVTRAGTKLNMPQKNVPDANLIKWHRENVARI